MGTLGEPFRKFDYNITYTAPKVECLPVENYKWEEEFEGESGQEKKKHEDLTHISVIDRVYEKVEANTVIDLNEADLASGFLYYRQPGDFELDPLRVVFKMPLKTYNAIPFNYQNTITTIAMTYSAVTVQPVAYYSKVLGKIDNQSSAFILEAQEIGSINRI